MLWNKSGSTAIFLDGFFYMPTYTPLSCKPANMDATSKAKRPIAKTLPLIKAAISPYSISQTTIV